MREGEREAREQGGRARALRGGKGIRGAERPPGPGLDVPASVSGYTLSESFIRPSPRPPTQALSVWAKRLRPAPAAPQLLHSTRACQMPAAAAQRRQGGPPGHGEPGPIQRRDAADPSPAGRATRAGPDSESGGQGRSGPDPPCLAPRPDSGGGRRRAPRHLLSRRGRDAAAARSHAATAPPPASRCRRPSPPTRSLRRPPPAPPQGAELRCRRRPPALLARGWTRMIRPAVPCRGPWTDSAAWALRAPHRRMGGEDWMPIRSMGGTCRLAKLLPAEAGRRGPLPPAGPGRPGTRQHPPARASGREIPPAAPAALSQCSEA